MKIGKQLFTVVVVMSLLVSLSPIALAAEESVRAESVLFSGLDQLRINECIERNVVDSNSNRARVGIERVADISSAYNTESTWRVWYTSIAITAEFYMTVSENRVTSVYDEYIYVVASSYKDSSLTMTSTCGELSFIMTTLGGAISYDCWLRGDITGSDNEINVTWQM